MKKSIIPSIILYIFAVLLAVFAVWSFSYCAGIISEAVEYGQITFKDNIYDIVSFYIANCAQYFTFALLLAAAGLLLQRKQPAPHMPGAVEESAESAEDDEPDIWFDEEADVESDDEDDVESGDEDDGELDEDAVESDDDIEV